MQYSFLLAPLLSSLSAFRMYLIAAVSAVKGKGEINEIFPLICTPNQIPV
jgi:hypothetical protein